MNEPVKRFHNLILQPDSRRCDIATLSMEPALFSLTATLDEALASYCFIAACIWPAPGRPRRKDIESNRRLRRVVDVFFEIIGHGAQAGGPESISTVDFFRIGLGMTAGMSELFAAYAAKGLDAGFPSSG